MGQGGGEAAPPAGGGEPTAAAIIATTILLFLFFIHQVFISRPRTMGGVTGKDLLVNAAPQCCANCGEEGGASLKACKACMLVKYCNINCQRNHWLKHKAVCKRRAAEIHDEALFKDPPPKEDCPICFLPMPMNMLSCVSLPPATVTSVPIYDFSVANEVLARWPMDYYYPCCGKSVCNGCVYSLSISGNMGKCPYCNAETLGKTSEDKLKEMMKRVKANDAGAIFELGVWYDKGGEGVLQDRAKSRELVTRASVLGSSKANYFLGQTYRKEGDLKKAKFYYEAAAMAGHELARCNIGSLEFIAGNKERALKHWTIAASTGNDSAMQNLQSRVYEGFVSRDAIDSILTAYNTSCAEMRSESRDAWIHSMMNIRMLQEEQAGRRSQAL
jgi:hypothetical protein